MMKHKAVTLFFSIMFAASLFCDSCVHARAGSTTGEQQRSSPSGAKRPVPSSGYGNTASKPSPGMTSPKPQTPPSKPGGGYGNTAGTPGPAAAPKKPDAAGSKAGYGNSATTSQGPAGAVSSPEPSKPTPFQNRLQEKMNKKFSKKESAKAFEAYKADQSKFQKGPSPVAYNQQGKEQATVESVRTRVTWSSPSDYYARRTVFYSTYRWQPPVYVYQSYNSFGIWDATILWFMLDRVYDRQYAAMYYHHRDDPGMQQFRKEVDRLSAENVELREQVKKLDESVKEFEQQGVKPDPSYVPSEAAGIVLAGNVAEKAFPVKESSGGFPWMWVILGSTVLAVAALMLGRRKKRR